jgi:hypothetical protein
MKRCAWLASSLFALMCLQGCIIEAEYREPCDGNRSWSISFNDILINFAATKNKIGRSAAEVNKTRDDSGEIADTSSKLFNASTDVDYVVDTIKDISTNMNILSLLAQGLNLVAPPAGTAISNAIDNINDVLKKVNKILKPFSAGKSFFEKVKDTILQLVVPGLACVSDTFQGIFNLFEKIFDRLSDITTMMPDANVGEALVKVVTEELVIATEDLYCMLPDLMKYLEPLLNWDFNAILQAWKAIKEAADIFWQAMKQMRKVMEYVYWPIKKLKELLDNDFNFCPSIDECVAGVCIKVESPICMTINFKDLWEAAGDVIEFINEWIGQVIDFFVDKILDVLKHFTGLDIYQFIQDAIDKILEYLNIPTPPPFPEFNFDVSLPDLPSLPRLPTLKFENFATAEGMARIIFNNQPLAEVAKCKFTFEKLNQSVCEGYQETGAVCPPYFELDGGQVPSLAMCVLLSLLVGLFAR